MKNSSKNIKDEDTSSISLVNYNKQDADNNDNAFLDDENQVITGQVEKFRLLEEPHKFDELIDSIKNGDLEKLKSSIERMCPTKYDKVQMFLNGISKYNSLDQNDYTCLIAEAMFCDLECFQYLLDLYEKVKPTMEELVETGKLSESIRFIKTVLFPFMVTGKKSFFGGNLLHYLKGEESISKVECLRKCSVLDQLFDDEHFLIVPPLSTALLLGEITVAEKMVELGAPIDGGVCKKQSEFSPIGQAVVGGHVNLVKKMLQIGKTKNQKDVYSNDKLYGGEDRSIFYLAIMNGNKELIEYLQNQVPNATELLSKEMKRDNRGPLEDSIVKNNLISLVDFFQNLKDISPEDFLPDTVIGEICMRAAELNNDELVSHILNSKHGSLAIKFTDTLGRTVLHHAVKYPELLKYLLETAEEIFEEKSDVLGLINTADKNKCTTFHYAAVVGEGKSLQILAKSSVHINNRVKETECDYILSCVSCDRCAEQISLKAIKYAIESTRTDENPRVQITKDVSLQTLALKGRTDLLEYLFEINVPGTNKSDGNGTTVLHAAAESGSLATVKLVVERLPKLLNSKTRTKKTPALVAAYTGQHSILKYLFELGVKPVDESTAVDLLNEWYLDHKTYNIVVDEILKTSGREGLSKAIRKDSPDKSWGRLSKAAVHIFDAYIWHDNSEYIYDFTPLKGSGDYTDLINSFIHRNDDESLLHPLVRLLMKTRWKSSKAQKWYYLNQFFYFVFLILLTTYVGLYSQGTYSLTSPGMVSLTTLILLLSSYNMVKELLQMFGSPGTYLKEDTFNNMLEWILYICTFVFLLPANKTKTISQIEAGAIAIFIAWINFIWLLKRLPIFGIYVVLTNKVFMSLLKILPVVILFVMSFAMTFMLLRSNDYGFSTVPWSALTTLIMMSGEIDYRDAFLDSQSSVYILQCVFLVLFFLVMGTVVMNVFVGLAVGDTDEMMKRCKAEKRLHNARLYVELQKSLSKLPRYFRPEEVSSVRLRYLLEEKTIEDKDKDSQMETKIEDMKSDLQNMKNDINYLTSLVETVLKRSEKGESG